ncbi:MAG TPA: hypothetical protein VFR69_11110 [Rubrobacteraceae bacterium]|nr:hypothetical protein [Rubrobacteraceae bacterium]
MHDQAPGIVRMASVQQGTAVILEQPEPVFIFSEYSEFDQRREQSIDGPRARPKLLGYFVG